MARGKWIGAGALAIVLLGYLAATPYITVLKMTWAAEKHDGEALSEYVDFPALRQSFKDNLNVALVAAAIDQENPFAVIGAALGGVLVDKLVDAYVTPAGLIALMSGARIESGRISELDGQADENQPFSNPSLSYESLNKFSVGVVSSEAEEEVKFILRRDGIGWKLTEIVLPGSIVRPQSSSSGTGVPGPDRPAPDQWGRPDPICEGCAGQFDPACQPPCEMRGDCMHSACAVCGGDSDYSLGSPAP